MEEMKGYFCFKTELCSNGALTAVEYNTNYKYSLTPHHLHIYLWHTFHFFSREALIFSTLPKLNIELLYDNHFRGAAEENQSTSIGLCTVC